MKKISDLSDAELDAAIASCKEEVKHLCTYPSGTMPSGNEFRILGILIREKEKRSK